MELTEYCKRSIFECPMPLSFPIPPGTKYLRMKLDERFEPDTLNANEIRAFQGKLIETLNIYPDTLELICINKGCVELIYSIPASVHSEIFPWNRATLKGLTFLGVTEIDTEGYQAVISKRQPHRLRCIATAQVINQMPDALESTPVPKTKVTTDATERGVNKGPANEAINRAIASISKHVGHEWKLLGRGLGFNKTDLDSIEVANPHLLKEQIHDLFYRWRIREGRNASVEQLVVAAHAESLDHLLEEAGLSGISFESALDSTRSFQYQEANVEADKVHASPAGEKHTPIKLEVPREKPNNSPENLDQAELRERRLRHFGQQQQQSPQQKEPEPSCSDKKDGCTATQTKVTSLEKGSCAMVDLPDGTHWYGVIQCIEELDINSDGTVQVCAGLEMETTEGIGSYHGSDGMFEGKKYFDCNPGSGLLLPLDTVKHDDRFTTGVLPAPIGVPPAPTYVPLAPIGVLPATTGATVTPPRGVDRSQSSPAPPPSERVAAMPKKSHHESFSDDPLLEHLRQYMNDLEEEKTSTEQMHMEFCFPGDQAGLLIGREGKNVQEVEKRTHTKIKIIADKKDLSQNGRGKITGSKENCEKALFILLSDVLAKIRKQIENRSEVVLLRGRKECGLVIGKKGKTLRAIQFLSGAKVKIPQDEEDKVLDRPRQCTITGSSEQIGEAKELIQKALQGEDITRPAVMAAMLNMLVKIMGKHGFQFF